MDTLPLVSIVMPVYGAERWIHRAVDSVLAQTFTDFELILIDDESPDTCGQICDEYAKKDARIRVIHQKNSGCAGASNRGIKEARGHWLIFVDDDDEISPYLLQHVITTAELYPDDCIMWRFTTYPHCMWNKSEVPLQTLYRPNQIGELYLKWQLCTTWSMLFHTSLIKNSSIRFDITLKNSEDFPLVVKYARKVFETNPNSKFRMIEAALYYYDNEDKSESVSHVFPPSFCESWCRTFEEVFKDIDEFFHIPYNDEELMYQSYFRTIGIGLYSRLINISKRERSKRIIEIKAFLRSNSIKRACKIFSQKRYFSLYYLPFRFKWIAVIKWLGKKQIEDKGSGYNALNTTLFSLHKKLFYWGRVQDVKSDAQNHNK